MFQSNIIISADIIDYPSFHSVYIISGFFCQFFLDRLTIQIEGNALLVVDKFPEILDL